MHDILVPRLNSNDATYVLLAWLHDDGAFVAADEPVALVETSKAVTEIAAPGAGFLHRIAPAGTECTVGQLVGRQFDTEQRRDEYAPVSEPATTPEPAAADVVVTEPAAELARQHGIALADLAALGKRVVKRSDVEPLVAARPAPQPAGGQPLSRTQRAVADAVTRSHRTIPTAFTVVRVRVDAALAFQRRLAAAHGVQVGLPELLVKAMAVLHPRFPDFFAELREDGTVRRAARPDVGVTVDTGHGLFIPVVRDPAGAGLAAVAEQFARLRAKAMRAAFQEPDFADPAIVLALNNDPDVVFTQPIVFPGHTCTVSLGGTAPAASVDADGRLAVHHEVHLGACYDHRVLNGREATGFLKALKQAIEDPDRLSDTGP